MSGSTGTESYVQIQPNSTGAIIDGFLIDPSGPLSPAFRQAVVVADSADPDNVAGVDDLNRLSVHNADLGLLDMISEDIANADGTGPGLLKPPFTPADGSEPSIVVQVSPNTPLTIDQAQATVIGGVGADGAARRMKIGTDGGLQLSDSMSVGPFFVSAATNQVFMLDTTGYQSVTVQTSGVFSATVISSQSNEGANWYQVLGTTTNASNQTNLTTGLNGLGLVTFPVIGRYFKLAVSTYTSGQIVITAILRSASSNTQVANIAGLAGSTIPQTGGAVTVALPVGGQDPSTASRPLRTDTVGALVPTGPLAEGFQTGIYNVAYTRYTVALSTSVKAWSSPAPILVGGIDQTNAAQFLLTDQFGAALVAAQPSTPANQSITELLLQLVALSRVQAQYLYDIRNAMTATFPPDEPDVLLADFSNPATALSNMFN